MKEEFNLSKHERHSEMGEVYYNKYSVKEFIRLLKVNLTKFDVYDDFDEETINQVIDKLAGDKLK